LADALRWPPDTPGGRFYAEWDSQAPVSREGQLVFFFPFLEAGDRWPEFLRDCPLHFVGNRGSGSDNVVVNIPRNSSTEFAPPSVCVDSPIEPKKATLPPSVASSSSTANNTQP